MWQDLDPLTPANLNTKSGMVFNVQDPTYGATGDGSTDDTSAITTAIAAANANASNNSGGKVFFPAGTYVVTSPIVVPHEVTLVGAGRTSSQITAGASFSADTAVIILGESGAAFDCRVQDLTIGCSNITGSVGVYSRRINEQSGVRNVLIADPVYRGIHIDSTGAAPVAQNYDIENVEVFMSSSATTSSVGIDIQHDGEPIHRLENVTVTTRGQVDTTMTCILIDGAPGHYNRLHVENCLDGIVLGSRSDTAGIALDGVTGQADVTNVIRIDGGNSNQNITIAGVQKGGGTNILADEISSVTLTDATLGLYALGDGSTPKVLTTASNASNIIGESVYVGRHRYTPAGLSDGSTAPNITGANFVFTQNTSLTTITQFVNGGQGQLLMVQLDANTAIEHDGSDISLANGSDYVGTAGAIITLIPRSGTWWEVSRSTA